MHETNPMIVVLTLIYCSKVIMKLGISKNYNCCFHVSRDLNYITINLHFLYLLCGNPYILPAKKGKKINKVVISQNSKISNLQKQ
jgi:hypothetical protein